MGKYKKRPVAVEAVQYTAKQKEEAIRFLEEKKCPYSFRYGALFIITLEGTMRVAEGDWLICGIKGEVYPCKDEIFRMTYEEE